MRLDVFIKSKDAELTAVLNTANAICAAARTVPKACRIDHLDSAILTEEDKDALAEEMWKINNSLKEDGKFFTRDADNVYSAQAIVLIGAKYLPRGLGNCPR
jgi:uncharacterized ferredoxin-like protein